MFINGEWRKTEQLLQVVNPATGQVVYEVFSGTREHVREAIDAAKAAFVSWSALPALERANFLQKTSQLLSQKKRFFAEMITTEMGKTIKDALGEVQLAIDYFRWFAEEARRLDGQVIPASSPDKRILVIKQPVGVVGAITPWNFPLGMLARKVAPALAVGCTMVIKPASQTPQTAIELCKVLAAAGLPKGVVNLVVAPAQEVSDEFAANPAVRKITFTGSTAVGKRLMAQAAATVKRVSMELGGHAPYIVWEDADLALAVDGILHAKFRCTGQMCTAANRIFLQKSIAEQYVSQLQDLVKGFKIGNGMEEDTVIGPLVSPEAIRKVDLQVKDAVAKGAKLLCGGAPLTEGDFSAGNFYPPTILLGVTPDMAIFTEETFGPVVPVILFETEEELMSMMNHKQLGLAAYFYTNDVSRIFRISAKLEYGMIGVNDPQPFAVQVPFGGVKESGFGREGGHQGLEDYVDTKMISIRFKL